MNTQLTSSAFLVLLFTLSVNGCFFGPRPKPPRPDPIPFTCGVADVNDRDHRIVGGQEADAHSIPWQVALVVGNGYQPFCGGTIVSPYHILTAAHCTWVPNIKVLVGEHNVNDYMHNAVRHDLQCIQNHPRYFDSPYNNDFSILTLKHPINLTSSISTARAACLPQRSDADEFQDGTQFVVSGWGTLTYGGDQPDVLHHVTVPYFEDSVCNEVYANETGYDGLITENMICAGTVPGGIDSCQGDSGGPLTWTDSNGIVKVVGVVSFGIGCGDPGIPGVYAKVTSQLSWMDSIGVVEGRSLCP